MKPKWTRVPMDGGYFYSLWLSEWEEYNIDPMGEGYQAMHNNAGTDRNLGPLRKTLRAAYNDVGREIRKKRARDLMAQRAKLCE